MDIRYVYEGETLVWNLNKAMENIAKHGVSFEEACQVFFDPFYRMESAGEALEQRWAITGYSRIGNLLYVVAAERNHDVWRIVSARKVTKAERKNYETNDPY